MPDINKNNDPLLPEGFSLVLGGPLYQLYLRCRLSRPTLELLHRRLIAFVLITWIPLLVLSLLAGDANSGVKVPFLHDLATHARFLVALPLMITAELLVHGRIRVVLEQFKERGIILPEDQPRFDRAVADALRWRNSVVVEVILLLLSFTLGYWIWSRAAVLSVPTWYGHEEPGGMRQFTPAGYWFAFVSLPLFRFVLLRWYFRLLIWYRFIWKVSRLNLQLNPLHPDRAGGLGFLAGSAAAFMPVLVAQSVIFAGIVGDRILHEGAKLMQYDAEIGTLIFCLLLIVLAPLYSFTGQLHRAQRRGMRRYGLVACRYVDDFQSKWIASEASPSVESLLGTADIQSLADLGNSYDVVREMRIWPFGKQMVIQMAAVILIPIAPLVLTMIPLRELIGRLMRMAI